MEYIVTLKDFEDLKDFYNDMESDSGSECVPKHSVKCCCRRPMSRNTHYDLTPEEAEKLKNDPRVLGVYPSAKQLGLEITPMFIQTESSWDKSTTNNSTHKNWCLLRSVEGEQRPNWGSNGTTSQSGTIRVNAEGKNVDIVIVDGMIDPSHPEFSDGTGGSRVIQYNWFQHNLGNGVGTYVYTPYVSSNVDRTDDNNHGAHVAGTVAGNSQGWARKANIYNINPYTTDINNIDIELVIDYIRAFHASKPVNQETGRRNPTICNHSWGFSFRTDIADISAVNYRGQIFTGPFTNQQLNDFGIPTTLFPAPGGGIYRAVTPARYSPIDADIEDAIAEGIIMVGAAGNSRTKADIVGGIDYNNYYVSQPFAYFYHEGSSPAAANGCICVGAVSTLVNETKATFSNCGPRVDIYAPGAGIMSSLNAITSRWPGTDDPGNNSYKIGKANGTSMASPQVAGVLACALEIYPNLSQSRARDYIIDYSKKNQLTDTGGGYTDNTSLQGSENRYLFYFEERLSAGNMFPKINFLQRRLSKQAFPRPRIRRTL